MNKTAFFNQLIPKNRNNSAIADEVIHFKKLLPILLDGLSDKNVRIKYGCLNIMVNISEKQSELLYPFFDKIAALLVSEKSVFRLAAIKIIGNLTTVDKGKKFDEIFNTYFDLLKDPAMTPGANVCQSSPIICKAKPYLREEIISKLLSVQSYDYKSTNCKNIILGKAIKALDQIFELQIPPPTVKSFAQNLQSNPWKATRIGAEKILNR